MAIVSACPSCKQRVSVADQHAGKQVRCPKCQQVFPVTAIAAAIPPAAVQPSPAAAAPRPTTPRREAPPPSTERRSAPASALPSKTPMFWVAIACGCGLLLLLGGGLLAAVAWLFLGTTGPAPKVNDVPHVVVAEKKADQAQPQAKEADVPPPAKDKPAEMKTTKAPPKRKEPPPAKKAPIINAQLTDGAFEAQSQLGPSDFDDPVRQAWTKTYQVPFQAGAKYSIELVSNDFGAYVILLNPSDFEIAEDYDKRDKHNAHIDYTPAISGPHRVIVTTIGRGKGDFTLTIRDLRKNPAKDG